MSDLPPPSSTPHSIAAVSFLNTKPLIEPLVQLMDEGRRSDLQLHLAVPSQLLPLVESATATVGLLSMVDYQLATHNLLLTPVGCIGCDGPTLTVRIYSRRPPDRITDLYGDTDSHTSVLLAQVILRERYGVRPRLIPYPFAPGQTPPDSLLLIGDKVVNAAPDPAAYPYQLDLGEQWKQLTGLPFIFACWMMRADAPPAVARELADLLAWSQRRGAAMTDLLLDKYAAAKYWPRDLARRYFTEYLRYTFPPRAREGIDTFFSLAARHDLLKLRRPLRYFE